MQLWNRVGPMLINAENEKSGIQTNWFHEGGNLVSVLKIIEPAGETFNTSGMIAAFSAPSPRVEVPKRKVEFGAMDQTTWSKQNREPCYYYRSDHWTRYAIDHDLISPFARIILGYMFGTGILVVTNQRKTSRLQCRITSGSMVINYFTFAAMPLWNITQRNNLWADVYFHGIYGTFSSKIQWTTYCHPWSWRALCHSVYVE